ncbi:DUF3501 family protein [Metallibacterium sp.]|uniref:DUF3501 family protein n=1 Tax=Metallibacterium sp. TaxID=2940281 RepID=UPI0026154FB5|nr:DUF3501 family protein [Metallibacterium sp.]
MHALTHDDLLGLERYARERGEFRARAMTHKRARSVHLGAHLTLLFEDRVTVQYQVQEMLRIERIFEPEAIAEELATYNPLIPDGHNLKATLLIEYPDIDERRRALERLRDIEHHVQLLVSGHAPVQAIADEDLPRSNDSKTAAVHFLRFELTPAMIAAWRAGAAVTLRATLPAHRIETQLDAAQQVALVADFD